MNHHEHAKPAPVKKAAFFDIDGTLISTNVVHAYGYYAANEGSLLGIAGRTASMVASLPSGQFGLPVNAAGRER